MAEHREMLGVWFEFFRNDLAKERMRHTHREWRKQIASLIRSGVSEGALIEVSPSRTADAVLAMLEGVLVMAFSTLNQYQTKIPRHVGNLGGIAFAFLTPALTEQTVLAMCSSRLLRRQGAQLRETVDGTPRLTEEFRLIAMMDLITEMYTLQG